MKTSCFQDGGMDFSLVFCEFNHLQSGIKTRIMITVKATEPVMAAADRKLHT